MATENPLLTSSTLPYRLPDYSTIEPEHYLPAFEQVRRDIFGDMIAHAVNQRNLIG